MSNPDQAKQDYDSIADDYNNRYAPTVTGALEGQLIEAALGDLTGLTVLDVGGGSGTHARTAVEQGAVAVDIIDVAPGMLKAAADTEKTLGRNVMRFFEADAGKPLTHLPLREEGYDVVMANWVLDYAGTPDLLEAMLRSAVGHLKSGGLFLGIRVANPHSRNLKSGKYGVMLQRLEPILGGVKYTVKVIDPPIEIEASALDMICSGSPEVYEKAGLTHVEIIPYEVAGVVQKNPEFWKDFVEDPFFAVTKAVKK
jgi:ubiquinone/menaquinone biosynthesis C-methylase UbiE